MQGESIVPEESEDLREWPGAYSIHFPGAPIQPIGDLVFGFDVGLRNPIKVESVFAVVDRFNFSVGLVSDFQGLCVELYLLDQEGIVVEPKNQVHLGDRLVVCAED